MKREKFFCFSLSRFAQASTTALIALVLSGAARADTTKVFDVKGDAFNVSGTQLGSCSAARAECPFSGSLTIDVNDGDVMGINIKFPGLSAFDDFEHTFNAPFGVRVRAFNNGSAELLDLSFTTPAPGSLVGFDGGSIVGDIVVSNTTTKTFFYEDFSGSVTPTTTVIPEPGTLGMLGTGLIGLAGVARRKLKL